MAAHNEFGKAGEGMAAEWLTRRGFRLLNLNWKYGRYEVDIIASRSGILHFIEVKARHDDRFGMPEDCVGKKKMGHLLKAGVAYQEKFPGWDQVQYDILSILIDPDGIAGFFFIEDVYCW
ncbi:MAG: YraN family protein [Bacteroidota bacterium]|nr:YraN family protein [Bacteroidota bacterium]MDP4212861.1 YraN family protein [Bacteroidota bacterium]MDP4250349.1 YraN family protein [Bacteroidota bacterium]